ncbi:MAG: DNA methyltransferase, partial [Ignavibacteriae bacterium]|nr:DNA methyltransferase [Ignavibacteriota bacterium]
MYTRFYRWSMDRIENRGIIGFVTNRSFIDGRAFDGFRKIIENDFSHCYVVDTQSDVRTNPKIAGTTHNVFGIQTGVAIMFLIKGDKRSEACKIYYSSLPDEWRKEEKYSWLREKQIEKIEFEKITPDSKHNWINQSDNDFEELIPLIDKNVKAGKSEKAIFKLYSRGVASQRDEWVYDFSKESLQTKVKYLIDVYQKTLANSDYPEKYSIKWDRELTKYLERRIQKEFDPNQILISSYRPYLKQYFYFDKHLNGMTYQWFDIISKDQPDLLNICIPGLSSPKEFHVLATNSIIDLNALPAGGQNLPLFKRGQNNELIENFTNWGLNQFTKHYNDQSITKKDIFHYVYAVLHNPAYRKKYE